MCVPGATEAVVGLVSTTITAATEISNYKTEERNAKYRIQAALNNAKAAQNEASRQKQLGIDDARKEKQQGIKEVQRQKAKNAAGGFLFDSVTSNQNYEDVYKDAYNNADNIQKGYEYKASNLFDTSSNYLYQAKVNTDDYKKNLYATAINGLKNTQSVAASWYTKTKKAVESEEL